MQFHTYTFFTSNPSLHELPAAERKAANEEFLGILQTDTVVCNSYATLGLKANTNIMLWLQADTIEALQDTLNRLMHTQLGGYLTISYTLLGMPRSSQYSHNIPEHQDTQRKGGKYLIIYPFTKTQSWYMLSFEQRKELMHGHITIGKKYPQISQLLLYSYGVDDQEFIVSYDTDDLVDFQRLVMELRSDKVRDYTLKDTPIFTCIYKSPEEVLGYL
jgi:chlorite dismutase